MHWDHEPADREVASWTAPVLWRFRLAHLHCQGARRLAHSKTWRGLRRFMEGPLSVFRMHWDHEPRQLVGRGVLTAPRLGGLGTARPTLRFMESRTCAEESALCSRI